MAFWDVAEAAMKKSLEVYKDLVKLQAVVEQIESRITDFRDEARKRIADFEHRIENRALVIEQRCDAKIADLEKRNRELESRMAQLEGKATAALAEAYTAVLKQGFDPRRINASVVGHDGLHLPSPPNDPA